MPFEARRDVSKVKMEVQQIIVIGSQCENGDCSTVQGKTNDIMMMKSNKHQETGQKGVEQHQPPAGGVPVPMPCSLHMLHLHGTCNDVAWNAKHLIGSSPSSKDHCLLLANERFSQMC